MSAVKKTKEANLCVYVSRFFADGDDDDETDAEKSVADAAKSKTAASAVDDDDDDDGTTCPICFDPWTSSGEHRV